MCLTRTVSISPNPNTLGGRMPWVACDGCDYGATMLRVDIVAVWPGPSPSLRLSGMKIVEWSEGLAWQLVSSVSVECHPRTAEP